MLRSQYISLSGQKKILDRANSNADTKLIPIKIDIMNINEVVSIVGKAGATINKANYYFNICSMRVKVKAKDKYFFETGYNSQVGMLSGRKIVR